MEMKTTSLKNQLLIAMPNMADPNFSQTITYICDHSEEGAMGVVVNRPLTIDGHDLFEHLEIQDISESSREFPIYAGGPVQTERGFVLHNEGKVWKNSVELEDGIWLTTSKDILEDIAHDQGPEKFLIALGYAGWGGNQLDQELADNAWLTVKATSTLIFDTPADQRWHASAQALGVDISLLTSNAGHA